MHDGKAAMAQLTQPSAIAAEHIWAYLKRVALKNDIVISAEEWQYFETHRGRVSTLPATMSDAFHKLQQVYMIARVSAQQSYSKMQVELKEAVDNALICINNLP